MFGKFEIEINNFLKLREYPSAFHEIIIVLFSNYLYDRFVATQIISFKEKAFYWFNILCTQMDLRGLFKRSWITDLRLALFNYYYAYICGKTQKTCPELNIAHKVHHLLEIETIAPGIFIWLENIELLPKSVPIFFDTISLKKDPATQNAIESETARALYMTKLHQYIRAKHPMDAGIEKILVEIFKMSKMKIACEDESLEIPLWINTDIIKNNRLCIDSEDRLAKILIPSYEGETYFSLEELQGQNALCTARAVMVSQCENYFLSQIIQNSDGENLLEEKLSVENGMKLSFSLCAIKIDMRQIELKRQEQLLKRKKTLISNEQVVIYLLILGEHVLEKIEITQGVIIFLMEIYYEICTYFEKLTDHSSLKFRCMQGLKKLLTVSDKFITHQELVYMLLCRVLQTEKYMKVLNNENQFDTVEKFFAKAMMHYSKHNNILPFPWANIIRKSVLESMLINDFHAVKCTMRDMASHFQGLGNQACEEWISRKEHAILPIEQRLKVELAIRYYTIIVWMANAHLFVETPKRADIKEYAKIKRDRLQEDLTKSHNEERLLLLTPGLAYIQAGNTPTVLMTAFLNEHPDFLNQAALLLKKRYKNSIKASLTDVEIRFLVEMYQEIKDKPYEPLFKSIFQLDVLWQVYNWFSKAKAPILINQNRIFDLSMEVESFIAQQEKTIFYEIANILLFNIRRYAVKHNFLTIYTPQSTGFCFTTAISSLTTVFFKSSWANTLRKESLLVYMSEFSNFSVPKTCNTLKKIVGYLTATEVVQEHKDILQWMLKTNMVTEKQIEENRQKPKSREVHCIEEAVLSLNDIVKDVKHSPLKAMAQEMQKVILLAPKNKTKTNIKKQNEKIKKPPQAITMSETSLEERAKLHEQERKNKIEEEQEMAARRQAIVLQNERNRIEQEALDRQKESEAWRVKREEQARLRAEKESLASSKSTQNTKIIRDKLRLKSEKKEEENNRLAAEKEAELKAKHERKLEEQKIEREKESLRTLQQYNLMMQQAKESSIAERSLRALRNFEIEEFTAQELPTKNKKLLTDLIKVANAHHIPEIQIYGSYTVFLASLRLNFPIKDIRRPGDLDLRIVIDTQDFKESLSFISDLQNAGYILKGYNESADLTKGLADYVLEKKTSGFLNLSLAADKEDAETYEIELAILFKDHYIPNHNPFYLLSHYIKISNNECAFDGSDLKARAELAQDVMNKNFRIIPAELFNPHQYNVFNFFPRLFRNIKTCKGYKIKTKVIQGLFTNLETIYRFFSIRFSLKKYRECYLELVGLINQNQFKLALSAPIIKGFLMALLEVINTEALVNLNRKDFFSKDIDFDSNKITQKLQEKFATLICVVHGDQDVNKTAFKKFYNGLMDTLVEHGDNEKIKVFLRKSQERKGSVLYNSFKKPENIKHLPEELRPTTKKLSYR